MHREVEELLSIRELFIVAHDGDQPPLPIAGRGTNKHPLIDQPADRFPDRVIFDPIRHIETKPEGVRLSPACGKIGYCLVLDSKASWLPADGVPEHEKDKAGRSPDVSLKDDSKPAAFDCGCRAVSVAMSGAAG